MATTLDAPALTDVELQQLLSLLSGARTAVLTGAGVSTDSGIPDYRGEGAPVRNPMTFQTFVASERARKRYWAGSHLGWQSFGIARPNRGHAALVTLELGGVVSGVVTQNVDGLHTRAGSRHVVDLHGSMDRVVCLDCGQHFARSAIAERLEAANPDFSTPGAIRLAPDGDVEVDDIDHLVVPECTVCGGVLKPDVVFFGEFVPVDKFQAAASLVQRSDVLLIAGSSLVVNSGIRLLELARKRRMPIVVVNRGVTKGDSRATLKLEAGTSETLEAIAGGLLA
ncbi:NAD-dependent protein deacetylase [Agromyces atrinae]|uniref:NAD-dependent protein deacetylase n=1 Tax=Agromyces atrinae TaxID=592376 RepID=UPI001F577D51|nr:NAD-dependent protein deacetylase [Agromyces atrinae]MCI2958622.1 NAD-dependent protein deacetylase [Agromyces atrinae]